MTILGELVVTVIGGIVTALVLERMGRARSSAPTQQMQAPLARPRGESTGGGLVRVILAVLGGIALATFGGRMLIQSGLMPKGLPGRLMLLVVGTALAWLLLSMFRRR